MEYAEYSVMYRNGNQMGYCEIGKNGERHASKEKVETFLAQKKKERPGTEYLIVGYNRFPKI